MLMWGLFLEAEEILVLLVSLIYLCMLTWKFRDCSYKQMQPLIHFVVLVSCSYPDGLEVTKLKRKEFEVEVDMGFMFGSW